MKIWLFLVLAAAMLVAAWLISAPRRLYAHAAWSVFEDGSEAARGRIVFLAGGCA